MKNHAKKHNVAGIQCDYYSESFATTWNKKQQKRGANGPSWKAPCGKKCQWPGKLKNQKEHLDFTVRY